MNYGLWTAEFRRRVAAAAIATIAAEVPGLEDNFEVAYIITRLRQVSEELDAELSAALSNRSEGGIFLVNGVVVSTGGNTETADGSGLVQYPDDVTVRTTKEPGCRVAPVGIGDYLKVEQKLICYKPGEIAHVENILKTEEKKRETRELRRREETYFNSTEREEETIKDLQTTDRYELQRESEKVVGIDMQASAGVNYSGTYGVTTINGSASFAVQTTQQEATRTASDYARSVTERASHRVLTRVREETTVKLLHEFEEKNLHGFDNTAGDSHVVGIYRWINKEYECQLMNYGQRMMFVFMVPEPGAFYLHAATERVGLDEAPKKPRHPRWEGVPITGQTNNYRHLNGAWDLDSWWYLEFASYYGVEDIEPYPAWQLKSGKSFAVNGGAPASYSGNVGQGEIQLPEGYRAVSYTIQLNYGSEYSSGGFLNIKVGNHWGEWTSYAWSYGGPLDSMQGTVPVSWTLFQVSPVSFNIVVTCQVTDEHVRRWQLRTFEKIMAAYERKLAEYNDALSVMKAQADEQIQGANPLRYRDVEKIELKRGCIQLLTSESIYNQFDAMRRPAEYDDVAEQPGVDARTKDYPWFVNCEAMDEGKQVQFFEMAFEWEIMSYLFHPYFWGRRRQWIKLFQAEDADPIFTSFLEAGYAQVIVPVRPGYEKMVAHFMQTGQIWSGQATPPLAPGDYVNYINQIQGFRNTVDQSGPVAFGPKWKVTLPTNLVILQQDADGIPGDGLPCDPTNGI